MVGGDSSTSGRVPSKSSKGSIGLLKRSRSMGTFDGILGRENLTLGQQAVEDISGRLKVADPEKQRQAMSTGDNVPAPRGQTSEISSPVPDETSVKLAKKIAVSAPAPPNAVQSPKLSSSDASDPGPPQPQSSAPILSPAGMDDNQLHQQPLSRVDYFSHDWNEEDIAGSWRYVISRRSEVANSARLENASWRAWAKAMYKLQTISPETVNWLKDYDVTWLYGPLYHDKKADDSPRLSPQNSSADLAASKASLIHGNDKLGFDCERITKGLDKLHNGNPSLRNGQKDSLQGQTKPPETIKSILKKKTIAEIMLAGTPAYSQHLAQESHSDQMYLRHHNYRHNLEHSDSKRKMANLLNQQYSRDNSRLDLSAALKPASPKTNTGQVENSRTSPAQLPTAANTGSVATPDQPAQQSEERHVHFNVRVEQCIALDPADSDAGGLNAAGSVSGPGTSSQVTANRSAFAISLSNGDDDEDDEDDDEDDDDEEEGGLFLGICRTNTASSPSVDSSHTIAPLPATTLKAPQEVIENDDNDLVIGVDETGSLTSIKSLGRNAAVNRQQVQPARQPAGIMANYDYGSVFPSGGVAYKIVDPAVKAIAVPQSVARQSVVDLESASSATTHISPSSRTDPSIKVPVRSTKEDHSHNSSSSILKDKPTSKAKPVTPFGLG